MLSDDHHNHSSWHAASLKSQPFCIPAAIGASNSSSHITLHPLPFCPSLIPPRGCHTQPSIYLPFLSACWAPQRWSELLASSLFPSPSTPPGPRFPFISRSLQAQHNLMGRRRPEPRLFNNALRGLFTKVRCSDEQLAAALMVRHIKCIIH